MIVEKQPTHPVNGIAVTVSQNYSINSFNSMFSKVFDCLDSKEIDYWCEEIEKEKNIRVNEGTHLSSEGLPCVYEDISVMRIKEKDVMTYQHSRSNGSP